MVMKNYNEEIQELEIEKRRLEIAKLKESRSELHDTLDQIDVLANLLDLKIIDTDQAYSENNLKNCFDDSDLEAIRQKIMTLVLDL